jgi:hypothetical protein
MRRNSDTKHNQDYSAKTLAAVLRAQKIATMPELMVSLGTKAERTVFRKLAELPYRTSYSHRGRYYTLDTVAAFDTHGLWSFKSVWFSSAGTLLATAAAAVEKADAGFFVDEIDNVLHVGTKDVLRKLERDGRIARETVDGQYLYLSRHSARRREQLHARKMRLAQPTVMGALPAAEFMPDEMKAAIVLFCSLLDEKQRRLYAGLESMKTGHGGDRQIAALLGLDAGTVAIGRRQLLDRDVQVDRVRNAGAGRKSVEKKHRTS